ncbi:MAG: TolC family protein [Bacteroidales bacterium]|nr:TolC family protein [Bacteroidales bacterium]
MLNRFYLYTAMVIAAASSSFAQTASTGETLLTLDHCRELALRNNKQMAINNEKIRQAGYQKKEAFSAYLPSIDFAGGYTYNQKNISIFDSDQLLPTKSFDLESQSYQFNLVKNPVTGEPITGPNGQPIPSEVALIPKDAMTFDIHNVFFGAVTLTQPIYMGGKIVALNKLAGFAEDLAEAMKNNEAQNIVYAVDAAYWQVVSLEAKQKLAESYVNLLDTLDRNVELMLKEGVATVSDKLSVDVKLNQANVDLVKVKNGVALSKMALAQLCGLPINSNYSVADDLSQVDLKSDVASTYNMNEVYARRQDIKALELGIKMTGQQKNVALSSMLPNVVLMGGYGFSNPNMFDGFKKKFNGAFSVGVGVKIPILHLSDYNKYRAAKSSSTIMQLQLEDAKEKINLQVSQAAFKAQEAVKTYAMTQDNLAKADENLRCARLGFKEGVMTADNVMEAQTAWLKANSDNLDASIDVHLCDVYLSKVLGTLK